MSRYRRVTKSSFSGYKHVIDIQHDQALLDKMIKMTNQIAPELGRRYFSKAIANVSKSVLGGMKSRINSTSGVKTFFDKDDNIKRIRENRTGRLKGALKIKNVTRYRPIFWKAFVHVKQGGSRQDPSSAYWGHMLEFGHKVVRKNPVTGVLKVIGYSPPRSFIRAGVDDVRAEAGAIFNATISDGIQKLWKKGAEK